jgi:hypothetical protein
VGVPHPTPARRVVVYAVKNGWMLDVDFSQNQCLVPQWVYTSLDCLAADVKSFLHDGTAYEGPLPAPLLDWQREAIIAQRDAARKARDAAIKERDISVAVCNTLLDGRDGLRQQLATAEAKLKILVDSQEDALKAARDAAIKERDAALKERDESNEVRSRLVAYADDLARGGSEARRQLAIAVAKTKILVDTQDEALKAARSVAYAIGYDAGGRYGFFHKPQ